MIDRAESVTRERGKMKDNPTECKGIEIHIRKQCRNCNGVGIVQHPEWAEWWRIHGTEINVREVKTPYPDCPEEIPCSECDGTGYVEEWVPLDGLGLSVKGHCHPHYHGVPGTYDAEATSSI